VTAAWAGLQAATGQIEADQAQIRAAELALNGVQEEERVGQRTTLDVLDAQQEVLSARVNLTTSQRNSVVASYSLLSAMGRLTARSVGLNVREYNPEVNTVAVQDRWFGLRTSDGN
jgi:outer membrane protein